jgi:hypothetical protein
MEAKYSGNIGKIKSGTILKYKYKENKEECDNS